MLANRPPRPNLKQKDEITSPALCLNQAKSPVLCLNFEDKITSPALLLNRKVTKPSSSVSKVPTHHTPATKNKITKITINNNQQEAKPMPTATNLCKTMQNSFSEEQKVRICDKIEEKLHDKIYTSGNEAAKMLNISSATLSNIRNKKWDTVGDDMWHALAAQLLPASDWSICKDNNNFRRFTASCKDAHNNKLFNAICAHTGAGKSTALKEYANSHPNAYYVWCDAMFTRTLLIQKIASAMGLQIANLNANELNDQIVQKLTEPNRSHLLILDSVHKLDGKGTIEYIGTLAEAVEHKAGLVIAGTEQLEQKITTGVLRQRPGYAELKRRVYDWTPPNTDRAIFLNDATKIINQNGINEPKQIKEILTHNVFNFGEIRTKTSKKRRINSMLPTK